MRQWYSVVILGGVVCFGIFRWLLALEFRVCVCVCLLPLPAIKWSRGTTTTIDSFFQLNENALNESIKRVELCWKITAPCSMDMRQVWMGYLAHTSRTSPNVVGCGPADPRTTSRRKIQLRPTDRQTDRQEPSTTVFCHTNVAASSLRRNQ